MGARRTVILVAAVIVAAVAAVITYTYLNGVQRRAYKNATLVKVFVVKKDVKKGLPGGQILDVWVDAAAPLGPRLATIAGVIRVEAVAKDGEGEAGAGWRTAHVHPDASPPRRERGSR